MDDFVSQSGGARELESSTRVNTSSTTTYSVNSSVSTSTPLRTTRNRHLAETRSGTALYSSPQTATGALLRGESGYYDKSLLTATTPRRKEASFVRHRKELINQRLNAYRQDLAQWFSELFGLDIVSASFISSIETGVLLCKLALLINSAEGHATQGYASKEPRGRTYDAPIRYNKNAKPGHFFARDNVACFIAWARSIGVSDAVLFETDDLVELKNEKNVLYCLMEVARVQTSVPPPKLVELEREFESGDFKSRTEADIEQLEAAVHEVCERIIESGDDHGIERVDVGSYRILGQGPFFMGLLGEYVMVKDGKQWDTLEHFLAFSLPGGRVAASGNTMTSTRKVVSSSSVTSFSSPAAAGSALGSARKGASSSTIGSIDGFAAGSAPGSAAGSVRGNGSTPGSRMQIVVERVEDDANNSFGKTAPPPSLPVENSLRAFHLREVVERSDSVMAIDENFGDDLGARMRALEEELLRTREKLALFESDRSSTRLPGDDEAALAELKASYELSMAELKDKYEHSVRELRREIADLEDEHNKEMRYRLEREKIMNEEGVRAMADAEREAMLKRARAEVASELAEAEMETKHLKQQIENADALHDVELLKLKSQMATEHERNLGLINGQLDTANTEIDRLLSEKALEAQKADRRVASEVERARQDKEKEMAQAMGDLREQYDRRAEEKSRSLEAQTAALKQELEETRALLRNDTDQRSRDALESQQAMFQLQRDLEREKDRAAQREKELLEDQRRAQEMSNAAVRTAKEQAEAHLTQIADDLTSRFTLDLERIKAERDAAEEKRRTARADAVDAAQRAAQAEKDAGTAANELAGLRDMVAQLRDENAQMKLNEGPAQAAHDKALADLRAELEAQIQAAREAADRDQEALTAQLGGVESRNLELEAELAATRDSAQTERASMEGDLLGKLSAMQKALEESKQAMEARDKENQAAVGDLNMALSKKDRSLEELEEQLAAYRKDAQATAGDLDGEKQRAIDLAAQIKALQAKLERTEEDAAETKEHLTGELVQTEDQLTHKREDLDEANLTIEDLRRRLAMLEESNLSAQEQIEQEKLAREQALREKDAEAAAAKARADADAAERERALAEEHAQRERERLEAEERERALQAERDADVAAERERAAAADAKLRAKEDEERRRAEEERRLAEEADAAQREADAFARAEEEARLAAEQAAREQAERDRLEAERLAEEERLRIEEEAEAADRRALEELEAKLKSEAFRKEFESVGPHADDLAEWINGILGREDQIDRTSFFTQLGTGVILCEIAEAIDAEERIARMRETEHKVPENSDDEDSEPLLGYPRAHVEDDLARASPRATPKSKRKPKTDAHDMARKTKKKRTRRASGIHWRYRPPVGKSVLRDYIRGRTLHPLKFHRHVRRGSPEARENVEMFIAWARSLGLSDPDIFSVEDVHSMQNPRRVVYGMYDVARRTRNIRVPHLVWYERRRSFPKLQSVKGDELDAAVNQIMMECLAQPAVRLVRIGDKKYTFGRDTKKALSVKQSGKNLLVRVGGGYEELKEFMKTHDKSRTNPYIQRTYARVLASWEKHKDDKDFVYKDSLGQPIGLHTTRIGEFYHLKITNV